MSKELEQPKNGQHRRLRIATAVVALLIFAFGIFLLFWGNLDEPAEILEPSTTTGEAMEPVGPYLEAATPLSIRIPKVNIDARFETPLGVAPSGEIEVPTDFNSVAYYMHGPTPGEIGPAVVLGHVDSKEGPAVFFSLGQLSIGDTIDIDRNDGTVATFAVTKMERHEQEGFPTVEVYGDIPYAGLRLITCTGIYDREELRCTHSLIVFAELVSTSTMMGG